MRCQSDRRVPGSSPRARQFADAVDKLGRAVHAPGRRRSVRHPMPGTAADLRKIQPLAGERDLILRLPVQATFGRRPLVHDGLLGDSAGRRQRLLDLRRVDEQGHAETVETLRLAVPRQVLHEGRDHLRIHLQQVADRVRVFITVEPPHRRPAALEPRRLLRLAQLPGDPFHDRERRRGIRPRFPLRRHLAEVDVVHDLLPLVRRVALEKIQSQLIHPKPRLRLPRVMAGMTMALEKGTNVRVERSRRGHARNAEQETENDGTDAFHEAAIIPPAPVTPRQNTDSRRLPTPPVRRRRSRVR